MSLKDERREYLRGRLDRPNLQDSPFDQLGGWLQQAQEAGLKDPTAMVLATVDAGGEVPRSRPD